MTYWLITKDEKLMFKISVDESAKDLFKKMMNWSEEQFQNNTVKFN